MPANSNNQLSNLSISNSLHQSLMIYQEQHQLDSLETAVVEILTHFFQLQEEAERYATIEQLNDLSQKVDDLSRQLAVLSQVKANKTPITLSSPTRINQQKPSETVPEISDDWKDVEDEPDEILHDFLGYE